MEALVELKTEIDELEVEFEIIPLSDRSIVSDVLRNQ